MKRAACVLALIATCVASGALAGDVETGRQIAESRCAPCHVVGRPTGGEVADAPPFVTIARKFPFGSGSLVTALRGPHPKMNFSPTGREAEDIAEYIRSLAH